MFKVKDSRTTTLTSFTPFSTASIVDFEQVFIYWDRFFRMKDKISPVKENQKMYLLVSPPCASRMLFYVNVRIH